VKNTFALINKVPPDILTLIPDYLEDVDRDQHLIKLTHVCRGWRETFTSRPSLWTCLDCTSVDKARVYIERAKSCFLAADLRDAGDTTRWGNAFLLVAPHIGRLKTLSIFATSTQVIPVLVEHFSCRVPLLENLTINVGTVPKGYPSLPDGLFDGDLSSLRELRLAGVLISLPRSDLSTLTTLHLCDIPDHRSLLTRLLDFFDSVPNIRHVRLLNSIPSSSDVPANRVLTLPNLKRFEITAQPAHSILLNHLSIPAGASLTLECSYSGGESPIPSHLPKFSNGLLNLSDITTVNLCFGPERRFLRLHGPSGELRFLGNWNRGRASRPDAATISFLQSLSQFNLSSSRWLTVQRFNLGPSPHPITDSIVYQTLRSMENLFSLTLVHCKNPPFILALNPKKNPSAIVVCPNLKEITFYVEGPNDVRVDELLGMAEERASRGRKLSVMTIVSTGTSAPKDVFQLRKHVLRLECKFDDALPEWDTLPVQAT
jgi:hypothetical protein